jgi:hypothetical protein
VTLPQWSNSIRQLADVQSRMSAGDPDATFHKAA